MVENVALAVAQAIPSRYVTHRTSTPAVTQTDRRTGQDLMGNTFWEFKDQLNHNRLRRTVRYNRKVHHSDVQVSPQWHQWLRRTRWEPPTMQEQAADVVRQTHLKHNAKLADERWAAKAKYIEQPKSEARSKSTKEGGGQTSGAAGGNASSGWQPESWVPGGAKT